MLVGLAAIPGVSASMAIRSRQRQQQATRQLDRGKLRLHDLQHRSEILTKQLYSRDKDRQEVELRVSQLQSLAVSLSDRIDRDQHRHQQLEQDIAASTQYDQEQQATSANLDRIIQEKQALCLELDTNYTSLKLELSLLQADKLVIVHSNHRAKIEQQDLQVGIDRCLIAKQELERQIRSLQTQHQSGDRNLDRSIEQQYARLDELNLEIVDRQQFQQNLEQEVDRLERSVVEKKLELIDQNQAADTSLLNISAAVEALKQAKQSQLHEIELDLKSKQFDLDELVSKILDRNNEIIYLDREVKTARLELDSQQAESDNLDLKIQTKLQKIEKIEIEDTTERLDPKPPIISRELDMGDIEQEWLHKFTDNPHLAVLQHIEKHGAITDAEASRKLGNARSVRQFANKLAEYTEDLPFSIRVESSPKGNRYLKEIQN
jgi:hypothetical protein